jgi:hypothetical protein
LQRELEQDARTRLDPSRPPLMRVTLLHLANDEWQLLWTTHHLCIDGWSWPRLFKEIAEIYATSSVGRPAALEQRAGSATMSDGWRKVSTPLAYWKEALASFAAPTPIALGPIAATSARSKWSSFSNPGQRCLSRRPRMLCDCWLNRQDALCTHVQGAWALLLSHYAGHATWCSGLRSRSNPEQIDGVETLIGPCVSCTGAREVYSDESLNSAGTSQGHNSSILTNISSCP